MKRSITPGQISQNNLKLIYQHIYQNGPVSLQDITYDLRLSRPTVSSKVSELELAGLIRKEGHLDSDLVGRKATAYQIVPDYRIAIGAEILKSQIKLLAVDLRGDYSHRTVIDLPYENTDAYIDSVCDEINCFAESLAVPAERILGIGLSVPGLVSADGTVITYGKILNCTGLTIDRFSRQLPFPCRFLHDASTSADTELWISPELVDCVFLNISVHLGASMIHDREILVGRHGFSATVEHIQIDPRGKQCYCGKRGCTETFCSYTALLDGESEELFFEKLAEGVPEYRKRWEFLLEHLALAINNMHLLYDTDFIIGGYMASHFSEEDIEFLYDTIESISPFPETRDYIRISKMPKHSITIGAALPYIRAFLDGDLIG